MLRVVLIAVAIGLAACAAAGSSFDWQKAKMVTVGMTEAEVVELMGKPTSVMTRGDTDTWGWVYASSSVLTGISRRNVSFQMKSGKVVAVPNLSQFE